MTTMRARDSRPGEGHATLLPPAPRGEARGVVRVAPCARCEEMRRLVGRDVGCLRHPREVAALDESGAQSVVDVAMLESEGR